MAARTPSIVLMCLCLGAAARGDAPQEDRRKAAMLWEQAIAAKGGRERLEGIRSFAIREKTRFRGFMTRDVATGKVDQIVCELPNHWWEFLDYRPGLMGYSVEVVDTRSGLGWVSSGGAPARPFLRPHTNPAYRMRQLQYVYFLETRSVRPSPLRTTRVRLGGGGKPSEIHVEINPDYEPSLFTTPPPPGAGIDSWRKRVDPK